MQLCNIALLFFGIATNNVVVTAERVMRFKFNGDPLACNATDNALIDPIFQSDDRRHLRTQRALGTNTRACEASCKGYTPGTCRVWNGNCHRRDLFQPKLVNRELQANLTCNENTNYIKSKLNRLIATKAVSPSCMEVIGGANREFECFDDVIYGNIDNVRLWNLNASTTNPLLLTNTMTTGRVSLCKSVLFTIEAAANTCVDHIFFNLVGPNYEYNRTEDKIPFSLFGNEQNILNGERMYCTGNYTLTMIPDENVTNTKSIRFRIKEC